MGRALIVLGDITSKKGVVVEASSFTSTGGIRVARVGDRVKCRHGKCSIATGDNTMIVDGRPVARHGDKTACGATLIASQLDTTD